jgi:hypothetical protein
VTTRSRGRANIGRPRAPDVGGVSQLCLLGAGQHEGRALNAPTRAAIVLVMLAVEPEARAVVAANRRRRWAERGAIDGEGLVVGRVPCPTESG